MDNQIIGFFLCKNINNNQTPINVKIGIIAFAKKFSILISFSTLWVVNKQFANSKLKLNWGRERVNLIIITDYILIKSYYE